MTPTDPTRPTEATIAEIAAGLAEIGTGGTPAFIRGYNRGYDDAFEHAAAERAVQPSAALRELAARIRAERDALPMAVIEPGEVLATLPDGKLLTEAQRGSLRGQGAAFGWVLNEIAVLALRAALSPAPTPVEPPVDALVAFAKALFREVPGCTGCDFDHGWDDHVRAVWNATTPAARLAATKVGSS